MAALLDLSGVLLVCDLYPVFSNRLVLIWQSYKSRVESAGAARKCAQRRKLDASSADVEVASCAHVLLNSSLRPFRST